jgi:hypothetical protein
MKNFTTVRLLGAYMALALALCVSTGASALSELKTPTPKGETWVSVESVLKQPIPSAYIEQVRAVGAQHARVFVGSIQYNQFWLYVDGKQVLHGPLGTGNSENGYETTVGVHTIFRKEGATYRSKKYPEPSGGAPMGYALFFTQSGEAVHASTNFRTPVFRIMNVGAEEMCIKCSRGCGNLREADAEKVHMFLRIGDKVATLK